jgi:hypothetical protein
MHEVENRTRIRGHTLNCRDQQRLTSPLSEGLHGEKNRTRMRGQALGYEAKGKDDKVYER